MRPSETQKEPWNNTPKKNGPGIVTIAIGVAVGLFLFGACSVALIAGTVDKAVNGGTDVVTSALATASGTVSQENAIKEAQNYIDIMGLSKVGLMNQLTSDSGSGYNKEDAAFAIEHINVDWNAEAVESAQAYLDTMSFSRSALIEQLHSKAGSGFTLKQATYATNKVGL